MRFLEDRTWLVAAMSEAGDGNLRVGPQTDEPARGERQALRATFLERAGIPFPLVTPYLVHGDGVAVVRDAVTPFLADTDALVTDAPGIAVGVTAADCVPVFLADPVRRAVGVAHAGWRGILAGVLGRTVAAMEDAFGSYPEDLLAAIGPCVRPCHFPVSEDVFERFPEAARVRRGTDRFVDLALACRLALEDAGVAGPRVEDCDVCTVEDPRFFSHRRGRADDEACLAAIAIRPEAR